MYCAAWHAPGLQCSALTSPQRFAVGLALHPLPNFMLAESNTPGNRLNPYMSLISGSTNGHR